VISGSCRVQGSGPERALPLDMTNTTTQTSDPINVRNLECAIASIRNSTRLAIRCDAHDEEQGALALGMQVGQMSRDADLTLGEVWTLVTPDGILDAPLVWHGIVDGWYGPEAYRFGGPLARAL
jgi:hypothetical protein